MGFHLDAPGLVIREMPVEVVHLVQRQIVDIAFDVFHREEMPHHVQVHPPVGEARVVVYLRCRDAGQDTGAGGQ